MVMTPRYEGGPRFLVPRRRKAPARRAAGGTRIAPELVREVLARFGLAPLGTPRDIPTASRADNVVVETTSGAKLLKRYKTTLDGSTIAHEHSILGHLAAQGFPAPRLTVAPDGTTMWKISDRWYALFDYRPGYFHFHDYLWLPRRQRHHLDLSARALAALHISLEGFTPSGVHPLGFTSPDGSRWRSVDWYLAQLERSRERAVDLEGNGADELRATLDRDSLSVERRLRSLDAELEAADLPRRIIHGDYGPYNLLFKPGERVMILDFEMARLDWRVIDLVKSFRQFAVNRFGLRTDRMAHFLIGYQRALPLECDEVRLLPSVWEFLTLRRVAVCWERFCEIGRPSYLIEAKEKIDFAHEIARSADQLSNLPMAYVRSSEA